MSQDIHHPFVSLQSKCDCDIEALLDGYRDLVAKYKPALHLWFLDHFSDPTEWIDARNMFTRSAAV